MTRGVWRQYQSPAEKLNDRHLNHVAGFSLRKSENIIDYAELSENR